jgi:hypothetical protein
MRHFVRAVRDATSSRNWYAALGLGLALPDMCGFMETPTSGSRARYVRWFHRFVEPLYTNAKGEVMLTGEDCYALRCAYLHQGDVDIMGQRARSVLERFHFVVTLPGVTIHRNQLFTTLQLQVDLFCEEICAGVESWLLEMSGTPVQAAIDALPLIQIMEPGKTFQLRMT